MSTIPFPTTAKFSVHRPPRPMMARDADSMFWMSRYVERAEHIARLLLISANQLIDVGDLAPKLLQQQWQSILIIMRTDSAVGLDGGRDIGSRIAQHMTFNADNPNSLISCISK